MSKIDLSKFDGREYLPEDTTDRTPWTPKKKHDPVAAMKQMPTRQLLAELDAVRAGTGFIKEGPAHGASIEQIKEELALRPHVPNKAEGHVLRRIMHDTRKTEAEVRAIPKYAKELAEAAASPQQPAAQAA